MFLDAKKHVFTVSEITQQIKSLLDGSFADVWVEGEISGLSRIATGTIFFNLKDSRSVLRCVMFYSHSALIKFALKEGMQVICSGGISVYEKDGKYQLYVRTIEPKGLGALQLALEQLKQKLEKEGLFKAEHKKPIPYLPARIGIVTSSHGAAIRDIFKVLERRFRDVEIIVRPARVQGEGASEDIAEAIEEFNAYNKTLPSSRRIDVLIVGRGGGSIEDLWAFNEEPVARAMYRCRIPIISAVGHERDWTIADLTADLRAPTPSAAAELAVPKHEDLTESLRTRAKALHKSIDDVVVSLREDADTALYGLGRGIDTAFKIYVTHFQAAQKKISLLNPAYLVCLYREKIAGAAKQMMVRLFHFLELRESRFKNATEKLENLSPLGILARGYSITFAMPHGRIIKDPTALKEGDLIKTKVHKGEIFSKVINKGEHAWRR